MTDHTRLRQLIDVSLQYNERNGRFPGDNTRQALERTLVALDELASLRRVVEAACEWSDTRTGMHTNGSQHMLAMRDTERALKEAVAEMRKGR